MIEDLSTLPGLEQGPWRSRYVQGLVDVPFLNLTPGTRSGIVQDEITVTDSVDAMVGTAVVNARGLPGYTFERAAGELWRCRFDGDRNIVIVNSGHRDFVFAPRNRALQLR